MALVLALSLLPLAIYKIFLWIWLGSLGEPSTNNPRLIPFAGLFSYWPWQDSTIEQIIAVVAPALICAGLGLWALWKRIWAVEVWVLLANVLLFVILLNPSSYSEYFASGRVTTGVVLAALFCLPHFDRLTNRNRLWLWVCSACWLSLWPAVASYWRQPPAFKDAFVGLAVVLVLAFLTQYAEAPRSLNFR
jgi:hypothetical protein